jgi:hypothetical protein
MREAIRDLLEPPPRVTVVARGQVIDEDSAFLQDGRVFIAADEVTRVLGWTVARARGKAIGDELDVSVSPGKRIKVPSMEFGGRTFLSGAELAEALDRPVSWDPASRTVTIP